MRKVCGLSVFLTLVSLSVSAAELSVIPMTTLVSMGSGSTVSAGDPSFNLKLTLIDSIDKHTDVAEDSSVLKLVKSEYSTALKRSSDESVSEVKSLKPVKRKVLVFKATWCGACQSLNYEWPKLKEVGWRIGEKETDHIQLVDADTRPDLMSRYGVTSLPTLVLVDDDEELNRKGSLGARNIAEFYYGRLK